MFVCKPREAGAIIFDHTRFKLSIKRRKKGIFNRLPDFKKRNTETQVTNYMPIFTNVQYWVWWPRESAAKGYPDGFSLDFQSF